MARNPHTTWEMLDVAMTHYQTFISNKSQRLSLGIVDLLHVSNFKGGNTSITEPEITLGSKLSSYEAVLSEIDHNFNGKTLPQLNKQETAGLIKLCKDITDLTKSNDTKIRGFGASYASALLSAHFMDLIPILDRRILNGAGIEAVWHHDP
ncbi:hypothetical protein ACJJIK_07740 [Microbulbifer sp. ZKSA006]|uniref:hypothetical protein n=1 Tax=Microbulbifer sp. ZKSA006 TaxID=3243390 RepID=UPI004039C551